MKLCRNFARFFFDLVKRVYLLKNVRTSEWFQQQPLIRWAWYSVSDWNLLFGLKTMWIEIEMCLMHRTTSIWHADASSSPYFSPFVSKNSLTCRLLRFVESSFPLKLRLFNRSRSGVFIAFYEHITSTNLHRSSGFYKNLWKNNPVIDV